MHSSSGTNSCVDGECLSVPAQAGLLSLWNLEVASPLAPAGASSSSPAATIGSMYMKPVQQTHLSCLIFMLTQQGDRTVLERPGTALTVLKWQLRLQRHCCESRLQSKSSGPRLSLRSLESFQLDFAVKSQLLAVSSLRLIGRIDL